MPREPMRAPTGAAELIRRDLYAFATPTEGGAGGAPDLAMGEFRRMLHVPAGPGHRAVVGAAPGAEPLQAAQARRAELARARSEAVVEDRRRIARDLHDTLAQALAAIIRHLESLGPLSGRESDAISVSIELARSVLADARRTIHRLRPRTLDGATLVDALTSLVARHERSSGPRVHLVTSGQEPPTSSGLRAELIALASEALTNAVTHAQASWVRVELLCEPDALQLIVADDGRGFDPHAHQDRLGLTTMRERARRIGASMTIASEPGMGTEVILFRRGAPAAVGRPSPHD